MQYRVISDSNYKEFTDKVNDALSKGAVLQGGVAVRNETVNDESYWVYYQAVTKDQP